MKDFHELNLTLPENSTFSEEYYEQMYDRSADIVGFHILEQFDKHDTIKINKLHEQFSKEKVKQLENVSLIHEHSATDGTQYYSRTKTGTLIVNEGVIEGVKKATESDWNLSESST